MNVVNAAVEIVLSGEQELAMVRAEKWLEKFRNGEKVRPYFVIEGFAGTGKSFTVSAIVEKLGLKPAYMAYTGKAALVLNKYSNVGATTIHSRIYKILKVGDQVFQVLYEKRDKANDDTVKKKVQKEIDELMKPKFVLNEEAFEEDGHDAIILDECSMVDDEILADLVSFGLPIIALGDPGQLPPVKGEGSLFKGFADARLTEIRRQALDNPIIKWSMWVREQRQLPSTYLDSWKEDKASKLVKAMVGEQKLMELFDNHDIAICWKNVTRQEYNVKRRKHLGLHEQDSVFPVAGDVIIFTKNDKEKGVFNGMFAEVVEVGKLMDTYLELFVMPETYNPDKDVPLKVQVLRACFEEYIDPDAFKKLRAWDFKGKQQADFGYCITCHKAQGSQWDKVLVLEENVFNWFKPGIQEQRARWLYTAITRAAQKVTMVYGK